MWPELLYRLNGADVGTQWLNSRFAQGITSANATSVDAEIVIPEDEVWLINNIEVLLSAGAAQTADSGAVLVLDSVPVTTLVRLFEDQNLAGNQFDSIDRQYSGMPIRGPVTIRATGTFSAAVAANQVTLGIQATRIPRGNWTRT